MTYRVGDKVRIVSVKNEGRWNPEGKMDKWLGKVMTIRKVNVVNPETYNMLEDQEERWGVGWCWYKNMIDCKIAFMIKCTRSQDDRFIVSKEYYVDEHGRIVGDAMDEHTTICGYNLWYKSCGWVDYEFELLEDYTKTENTEEEVKMEKFKVDDTKEEVKTSKYKVGDLVKFADELNEEKQGIGKIVETNSGSSKKLYLIELPKELHEHGHKGNGFSHEKYDENNYWFIGDDQIQCKVEETTKETTEEPSKTEVKRITKGIDTLVQDVYRGVQDKKGNIKFNKVKMKNLCFVKFDGCEKVYTFNNPTDTRLDEGTKVLVDSCGREMDATVIGSIKIQKKYVKYLMLAMAGRRDLQLKNILGVYETKTVKVEELTRLGGAD